MRGRGLVEDTGRCGRAAVLADARLIELRDCDRDDPAVTGALFAARVTAVDARLNAAFVDCGLDQPALLVAKDARAAAGSAERLPIRQLLREGQRLVVQGLREPAGDKGARVTADVKLLGHALVHSPLAVPAVGPARREATALHARAEALFPDGGFALRRHAADLADAALLAEAEALRERWRALEKAARSARPGRLPESDSELARLVRGLLELRPQRLEAAEPALLCELRALWDRSPALPPLELVALPADQPAFVQTGVDVELERALAREVPLPGGGRVLIEPTAALVAIDVDGGGRAALEVDLAAAREIARQVRRRNLGGTIVIDFVDLPRRPERQRLEEALRKAFRADPAPLEIHPMSPLGLVALSRDRRGAPLASRFLAPCGACDGSGVAPSPRALAERVLRALRDARSMVRRVRLPPATRDVLAASAAWGEAVRRLGHQPELVGDRTLAAGLFVLEDAHGR